MHHAEDSSALARILNPVSRCLTPEVARALVALRVDPETNERIEDLAEKSTAGELSPAERAEYQSYVSAIDFVSVLQAKARALLAVPPGS
jgi:hypothetical protein